VARDDHKLFVLAVCGGDQRFLVNGRCLGVVLRWHVGPTHRLRWRSSWMAVFVFGFSCSSLVVLAVCFVLIKLVFAFRPKCVTDSLFSSSFYVTAEASFWLAKFYLLHSVCNSLSRLLV
jgi:hypothetical protein